MPHMKILDLEVFYRDEGRGPTVILGHSSTGSSGQWCALLARLKDRYRVIAPDHLGYGRTLAYTGSVPLIEHELTLIEALMNLGNEPVHLVGHSYGGGLMAHLAVRAPDRVRSLTLIEPTLFHVLASTQRSVAHQEIWEVAQRVIRCVEAGHPEEAAQGFIDYWVALGAYGAMDRRVQASVTAGMPKLHDEWLTAFNAHGATLEALAALNVPIQLVAGCDTTRAAREVVEVLRGIWPGAAYEEIAGAGHMSPLTHTARVNDVIERFLDEAT